MEFGDLEAKISELEARFKEFQSLRIGAAEGQTHGCTHTCTSDCPDSGDCTYDCTHGCTNGCTEGCGATMKEIAK